MRKTMTAAAVAAAILMANGAMAAPDPAGKCEASKNKIAGAYYACREKAEAVAISKGTAADYGKCIAKFDEKWAAAETLGSGMCPDNVLTPEINVYLAGQAAEAARIIAGTDNVPVCGDDQINVPGEQCDGDDLGGNSCTSLGHDLGALGCSAGCALDVSGCKACPGFMYEDACWIVDLNIGISCDAACAAVGMVYDPATATVAGSGGTDAACEDVLDGLGLPGGALDLPSHDCGATGLGCAFTFMSDRLRCATPTTTSSASLGGVARACACQ